MLTGSLTRATGEDVGSYAIDQGTLASNANYTISFTGNHLSITKATLIVTADAQTKTYGSADPTLTYVVDGLAFSDDAASLLTGTLSRATGENVGTYVIGRGTLDVGSNYSLSFVGDNLVISKATLNVTANAQTKILNTGDPALTYVITGLQYSDQASGVLTGVLRRVAGEDVGDYAINQGTLAANNNYAINFSSNPLTIWNPASQVVFQSVPANGTAGVKFAPSLKVAVLDANGDLVTTDSSLVTIRVSSGPGDFTAGSTLTVAAVHGIATFSNLILNTSGSYTVSVSDGALTTATSSAITINPAAASQVVLQQFPTTGTAGVALSPAVVVAVQDKFGNLVQTTTVVTLTMSGAFSTGQTSTSAAAVNGVATFSNLVINKAGAYSLHASVGSIISSNFNLNVSAVAASKVAFLQPPTASVNAGVALNPTIQVAVQDQFGNVVTNDHSTVTLTLSSGTFSNNSATINVTAVNGIATFENLTINKIGTYKLTASVSSMTVSTQNFTVVPGVISSLSILQKPTTGTAGVTLGTAVQIAAWDQFGNAISSATTVSLTLASGAFATKGATVSTSTNAGIASFSNLSITTAGTYTVSASSGSLTGPSFNVTINPAAASKVVFQQVPPATGTAGITLSPSVVVVVQDTYGNRITTDNSTVTLTLSGGTFSNGATAMTVNAVNGIATFANVVLSKVGTNYTLTASDGSLAKATSAKLTINPGAPSQLAFQTVPAKGTAGVAMAPSIKVAVLDSFGNVVTSDNSSVTLTLSAGTFSSGASTATVAAVNGIATFDNVTINKAGTFKITASDGNSITTATSPNIVISPNVVNALVVQQNPTTGTAGVALGTAVLVQVLDQYQNLITTSSTVKLTLSSGMFSTKSNSISVTTKDGIASFNNLIFNAAGTYSMTCSVNSVTGPSINVTINPAAASKLIYSQSPPSTAVAGTRFSPAVLVSVVDPPRHSLLAQ